MEALRDMEASLPEAGERTEPLVIPSGVFVFGGGGRAATTSAATPSNAVDPSGGKVIMSPLTPERDGTAGRQARRMSASKSSSRRRRGSSSSWASTAAMSSKLRSKQTPEAAAAAGRGAQEEGSLTSFATAAGGVSDRTMADPNVNVEDGNGPESNSSRSRSEMVGDEAKEDGGGMVVASPRERGEGGRSSWSGMDRKAALRQQQQRLLLLRHASKCPLSEEQGDYCQVSPDCSAVKRLWKHIADCQDKTCMTPHCASSRFLLSHYLRCKIRRCPLCCPVRATIAKERRRLGQQQSSSGGEGEDEDDMEKDNDDDDDDDEL